MDGLKVSWTIITLIFFAAAAVKVYCVITMDLRMGRPIIWTKAKGWYYLVKYNEEVSEDLAHMKAVCDFAHYWFVASAFCAFLMLLVGPYFGLKLKS